MYNELTTTSVVSLFDTTKAERESFIRDFIYRIEDGLIDPITAHYSVKCMEDIIKTILTDEKYKECILASVSNYGQKLGYKNSEIQIKETGVKYDFTNCNDPEYLELKEKLEHLNYTIKEREKFLKQVPEIGLDIKVNDEIITIKPPVKTSTTSVMVTLK